MQAKIKVDTERIIGTRNPMLYGGFVEHLGRCIYGGLVKSQDDLTIRKDVLEAAKRLCVPILRWPGGNYVSGYHWQDGVGPLENRVPKIDLAWGGQEPNTFGTAEFIDYCRTLGTEPFFCVNMGTGTAEEAAAWVEYTNGTGATCYANMRKEHGFADPFKVRYWGLGNEVYGDWQICQKDVAAYADQAREYAKMMKWVDKDIQLVACGANLSPAWDRTVLDVTWDWIDYISIHEYFLPNNAPEAEDPYHAMQAEVQRTEARLRILEGAINEAAHVRKTTKKPLIAFDEWNVWYRTFPGKNNLEEIYDLGDALTVAAFLHLLHRHCNTIGMANLAQLVNVIAPIFTNDNGMFLQTIFAPLELYAARHLPVVLEAWCACERFPARENETVPYLDVLATAGESNEGLCLSVVNRHPDKAISAKIEIANAPACKQISVCQINGPAVDAVNTFGKEVVKTTEQDAISAGDCLEYTFAAHSITMFEWKV